MAAPVRQRRPKGKATSSATGASDPRFANFQTDPRYRLPSKKRSKVDLDSRFSRLFSDDDFHRKARVDRYGRRVEGDRGKRELERFYQVSSRPDDESNGTSESGEDDGVVQRELKRASRVQKAAREGYDPAREGGFSSSESDSSDEEEELSVDEEVEEAEALGPADGQEVPMGDVTSRLAIVNLDWDNVRAIDLMAVASSFAPSDGHIVKVTVYPSEFGRERMQREETEGPPPEIFAREKGSRTAAAERKADVETVSGAELGVTKGQALHQTTDADDYDSTALRRYQIDRLRYFYAVVTCSSNSVAQALYENMDGREYLSSANFFDLRFIPDDVSFDDDVARDECDEVPEGYRPNTFVTDALQHSKVKLTWDADDRERKDVQKRAFGRGKVDVEENDLMAYIASASSGEEGADASDDEESRAPNLGNRYGVKDIDGGTESAPQGHRAASLRAALGLDGDKATRPARKTGDNKPTGNLQITFSAGLSEGQRGSVFENEPEETTKEKYVRKERERKARRKEKAKAGEDGDAHTSTADAGNSKDDKTADYDTFDDPFFEDPAAATREAAKQARKADKERSKRERVANEEASAKQRAELELLMAEEGTNGGSMRHFDMKEIAKQEKQKNRKGRDKDGKRLKAAAGQDTETDREAAGFSMNVDDPRFAKVFESHEYAIDPHDPRYKGTKGMRALLEESRKKRSKRKAEDAPAEPLREKDQGKKAKSREHESVSDVNALVRKVKQRSAVHG